MHTVAMMPTPTHMTLVRSGSPEMPVACPRYGVFSIATRMISLKPSVTMAR